MTNYSFKTIGACFVFLSMFAAGCDSGSNAAAPQQKIAKEESQPIFNSSDKSINTNGNLAVAISVLPGLTDSINNQAVTINATTLTKSPYSSIGKLIKIQGEVFKVEEAPGTSGKAAEVLLLAANKNNPLGASTVSFLYFGDISKINSGDVVWCTGFFIGTYDSQNAMGGAVEGLSMVGNKISS